jgi:hypothetical protein
MVDARALHVIQASTVGPAHVVYLAADGNFAPLEFARLEAREAAGTHTLRDAMLLESASLVDGGGVTLFRSRGLLRSGLSKANGGSQSEKPDA